jgi:uncharacterized protein YecT (DUF1311 family)
MWLSNAQGRLSKALRLERKKFPKKFVDASEAAWIAYRNAECGLQAAIYSGGSIYPLIVLTCEEHLTDSRTAQVQSDIANASH